MALDKDKIIEQIIKFFVEFFSKERDVSVSVKIPESSQNATKEPTGKLTLTRTQYRADGIFSELKDENNTLIAVTLEHAYIQPDGSYAPKLSENSYKCVRGKHRLASMTSDFTTYEITGVVGHTNILFHSGNKNDDSEGCCLLGESIITTNGVQTITNSRLTFQKFMTLQNEFNNFELVVCK